MLQVEQLCFGYDSKRIVIDKVSFSVFAGEHLSIVGESGCGKSTLLKLIYGKYDAQSGTVHWKGQPIYGPSFCLTSEKKTIKYLTQDSEVMPFITVAENVGRYLSNFYPLRKKKRVNELLELVGLLDKRDEKTLFLSGGERQRIALAMTLAHLPELLLLDEPFSHIDNGRKNTFRRNLFAYLKDQNVTCIVATHDIADALSFSDQILIMKQGKIHEKNTPYHIYHHPKDTYTAALLGESSWFEDRQKFYHPHQIRIVPQGCYEATVKASYFQGANYLIILQDQKREISAFHSEPLPSGEKVTYNLQD